MELEFGLLLGAEQWGWGWGTYRTQVLSELKFENWCGPAELKSSSSYFMSPGRHE
jgi:hypothetical protein